MTPRRLREASERLRFHLEHQPGFWLGLVVGDDDATRAELRAVVETWCSARAVSFTRHDLTPATSRSLAAGLAQAPAPGLHWITSAEGGAIVEPSWRRALPMLNERRDALREGLDGGLILEGPLLLKRWVRILAPDLFSVRACVLEPGAEREALVDERALHPYLEHVVEVSSYIDLQLSPGTTIRAPIEELYTPLRAREGGDELTEVLHRHRHLLILGPSGSGKSTFIKLTASLLARVALGALRTADAPALDRLSEPIPSLAQVPDDDDDARALDRLGEPIPALLRARDVARSMPAPDRDRWTADPEDALIDALTHLAAESGASVRHELWEALAESGRLLILVDGLDGLEAPTRTRLEVALVAAAQRWPAMRLVVTSRFLEGDALATGAFHRVHVAGLDKGDISRFLARWAAILGAGPERAATLERAIRLRPSLRSLARSPLMLTLLCVVDWHGGLLPGGRLELLDSATQWMLRSRVSARRRTGISEALTVRLLGELALWMIDRHRVVLDRDEALAVVADALAAPVAGDGVDVRGRAERWLDGEPRWSGLVENAGGRGLSFTNRSIQEYLAARRLCEMPPSRREEMTRRNAQDPFWREVIALARHMSDGSHDHTAPDTR